MIEFNSSSAGNTKITLESTDKNKIIYIIGRDEAGFYLLNSNAELVDSGLSLKDILELITIENMEEISA